MEFFSNGCGNVNNIDKNNSYSLNSIQRGSLIKTKMLVTQYLNGILDYDDAYIITFLNQNTEPFPNTNITTNIQVSKVCDISENNCDVMNVFWKYIGDYWYNNSDCNGLSSNSTQFRGNYGLCHNGASNDGLILTYYSSSLYGNRSGYSETKLWGLQSESNNYQEKIWYK